MVIPGGSRDIVINVILADDYPLIREILKEYFNLNYPEIKVIEEAKTGQEAVELTKELSPNFVIMDVKMPIMDGITATELIKQMCPNTDIICYTGYRHELLEHKAITAGASAFFLKPFDLKDIANVIMQISKENCNLEKAN